MNTFSGFILLGLNILFVANVFCRLVLRSSIIWAEDFICYAFVALVWLNLFALDCGDKHLSIDFLYDHWKEGSLGRKILWIIRWATSLFTAGFLTYSGLSAVKQAAKINTKSISTGLPYKYIYGVMLAGILLLLLYWIFSPFIAAGKKKAGRGDKTP